LSLELHLGDGFSVAKVEFVLYSIRISRRRKIKKNRDIARCTMDAG